MSITKNTAIQNIRDLGQYKKGLYVFLILCMTLLFSGCESWDNAKKNLAQKEGYIPADEIKTETIDPGVYAPEKFTYYFQNEKEGILTFMQYSQTFLYCSIPDVKDRDMSDKLKSINSGLGSGNVKLIFDLATAFENHNVAPIPRKDSFYNTLYASGIDIKVSQLNTKFCVNEKGVLFFSSNAYEITEIHIFYSQGVSDIYKTHFEDVFNS